MVCYFLYPITYVPYEIAFSLEQELECLSVSDQ